MAQSPRVVEVLIYGAATHLNPIEQEATQSTTVTGEQSDAGDPQASNAAEPDAMHENAPVTASAYRSRAAVRPGQTFHVAVAIDIQEGWHLYGPNPEIDFVKTTTVSLKPQTPFEVGDIDVPEGHTKKDPVLKEELTTYAGRIWFRLPVTVSEDAETGETQLVLELNTQACDARRCLPPRTARVSVPLTIDPNADADPPSRRPEVFAQQSSRSVE